jgi:hypothetical protein
VNDQAWLDYCTALGQEFSQAIDPDGAHDLVPMDAADAVVGHLGREGARSLARLTQDQREALARHMAAETDCPVTADQVDQAIDGMAFRWPS